MRHFICSIRDEENTIISQPCIDALSESLAIKKAQELLLPGHWIEWCFELSHEHYLESKKPFESSW